MPPVRTGGQYGALRGLGKPVRACPGRHLGIPGLDDRNIQKGRQGGVGGAQSEYYSSLLLGNGANVIQPPGKPGLGALGQLEGGHHVGGGEG